MDLVEQAGVDVTDWANFSFAAEKREAAANPRYCYNWSFLQPGIVLVLCLWHHEIQLVNGDLVNETNPRRLAERMKAERRKGPGANRARSMDLALQAAVRDHLPVRVVIVSGGKRPGDESDTGTMSAKARLLDPSPWKIAAYDMDTGQCRLVRLSNSGSEVEPSKAPISSAEGRSKSEFGQKVFPFTPGVAYTRQDIQKVIGMPEGVGGDFYTGYSQVGDDFFIFCGVGVPGRTGHQYENFFEGDELVWRGKTNSRVHHPQIQSLLSPGRKVYVFFREDDRAPFTFAGLGTPLDYKDEKPVLVRWGFSDPMKPGVTMIPEEIGAAGAVLEGAKKTITVNVYERDASARRRCIERWKCVCVVCDFDFEKTYGELGLGYIHVHHLKPLGEIREAYELDPEEDLRPVCPNCHAMLHRRTPALSIEELRGCLSPR